MKQIFTICVAGLLIGCAQLDQKRARVENLVDLKYNPDQLKVRYEMKNNEQSFYECRCSGKLCDSIKD